MQASNVVCDRACGTWIHHSCVNVLLIAPTVWESGDDFPSMFDINCLATLTPGVPYVQPNPLGAEDLV